jgi:hypothetical protein
MSRKAKPIAERIWPKVDRSGGCWTWLASLTRDGYGQINAGRRGAGMRYAHIVVYELLVGPVPTGLELDHKCRNRACVNPAHLEPVTHAVNVQRGIAGIVNGARQRAKTSCVNGHPLEGANLYARANGSRECRTCRNAATHRRDLKRRSLSAESK